MFSKKLKWSELDNFGQREAKDDPFTFIAWQGKEYAELRLIRRDNEGGIIVYLQDFSIYCRDLQAAMRLAEKVNKALRKSREYNKFQTLF